MSDKKHTPTDKIARVDQAKSDKLTVPSQFTSVTEMLEFGELLVKSKLTPLDKAEDVMAAILAGKELGLGVMVSVNNIYPINGRATCGVHIINALLSKAGVTYEVIRDYAPLYSYIDESRTVYGEKEVAARPDVFQIVTSKTPKDVLDHTRTQVIRVGRATDFETVIKFTRIVKLPNGEPQKVELTVSRSINDYIHLWEAKDKGGQAKDNWINNMKGMLFNRVIAVGGRAIASDAVLGMYLTEELEDETNTNNFTNKKQGGEAEQTNEVHEVEATVVTETETKD